MIVDTRPLIVQQVVRCDHLRYDEDDRPQCLKQTMPLTHKWAPTSNDC